MTSNGKCGDLYIYQIPYSQHQELCKILDRDTKWEELGGKYMEFDMNTIIDLRRDDQRGRSPTSQLLTMWGQQNHTVVQLFVLLSKMHHYQAMMVLKPLVDSKYYPLLHEGEESIKMLLNKDDNTSNINNDQNSNDATGNGNNSQLDSPSENNDNVWGDNLDRQDHPRDMGRDKVLLPPEQLEKKIINKPSMNNNDPGQRNTGIPRVLVDVPSSDVPVHAPQPFGQQMASALRSEGRESNLARQERKMSGASDVSMVAESIPLVSYHELELATRGWDKKTIIGKGGFGTVFKGNWKNTLVAIKRIEQRGASSTESHQAQMEQLLQELRILNSCRHDNILPLYGFSMDGVEPCLVYQFMLNGSLEDRLLCRQGTPPLSWIQRHHIARGTARGLQFLHVKPFIHGDIKSANILLDKNYEPRIGDFGLARDGPQGHYTHMKISRIHGTVAYLPIDFLRNKHLSTKVDTYSFGIVIFELTTGLRAYDDKRPQKLLKDFVCELDQNDVLQLHDRKPGLVDQLVFDYLMKLGKTCACERARDRPEMELVLQHLEAQYCSLVERSHYMSAVPRPSPSPVPCIGMSPEPQTCNRPIQVAMLSPVSHIPSPPSPILHPAVSPLPVPYQSVQQDNYVPLQVCVQEETHSSILSPEEPDEEGSSIPRVSIAACSSPNALSAVLPLLSVLGTVGNDTNPPQRNSSQVDINRVSKEIEDNSSSEIPSSHVQFRAISRTNEELSSVSRSRRINVSSKEKTAKSKPLLCGDFSN